MAQVKLKGIDVSDHNGVVDFDKVKADGIDFVMIRLGIGSDLASQDDKYFERNVSECERVGLPWGVYLYGYALNLESAKSERDHILRKLKGKNPVYPVAYDMEDADGYKAKHGMPSNSALVDICYTVLSGIEEAGYHATLYAGKSWLDSKLNSPKLDRFDKWVAQWADKCTYNKPYTLWQYDGDVKGAVDGVSGAVDLNYCYFDFAAKKAAVVEAVAKPEVLVATPISTKPVTVKPAAVVAKPVTTVKKTSGYAEVKAFQAWLNKGYKSGIDADGLYGPKTQTAALKAFQTELNKQFGAKLVVDGVWGPATKKACPYVKKGMKGNITRTIQGMLYCLGFDPTGFTGNFGVGTQAAVVAFQKSKKLSADGVVGSSTFEKLFD